MGYKISLINDPRAKIANNNVELILNSIVTFCFLRDTFRILIIKGISLLIYSFNLLIQSLMFHLLVRPKGCQIILIFAISKLF